MDQVKGRIKEAAGVLMDDERLKQEGMLDQVVGKVKDTAEKAVDSLKDALTRQRPLKGKSEIKPMRHTTVPGMNVRWRAAHFATGLVVAATLALTGCPKKGPAAKAGEAIDRATDKVSDTLDPKGPAEKAGRAIDRATE